jgi:frataxin-like iron-binding protein CyaY
MSGKISRAQGSFPVVLGVQSIVNNDYSLQLNSNFIPSSGPVPTALLCQGAHDPSSCMGWQQFIFSANSGILWMQYWLLNYDQGGNCPAGGFAPRGKLDCVKNSKTISVPRFRPTELANMNLIGQVGDTDTVTLYLNDDTTIYTVSRSSLFGLNQGWTSAEFNVVGGGNLRQATFNGGVPGVTIVTQTLVDGTSTQAPTIEDGTTGETNNLNLVPASLCTFGAGVPEIVSPGIQFMESNVAGMQPQACPILPQQMPVAFQGQDTNLWLDQKGVGTSQNLGMAPGTVPSLVTLPDGSLEFAAQANTGNLWLSQNGAGTDLGLGMMAHTSPSAVVLPNGNVVVAFQANTGELWLAHDGTGTHQNLGMMAGTSPSAVVLPNGQVVIAAQANTGNLWLSQNGAGTDLGLGMMIHTSPSAAVLPNGKVVVAFQANTGELWLAHDGIGTHQNLGMMAGTSPSAVVLGNGQLIIAAQANTSDLWVSQNGAGTDLGLGMARTASPSITTFETTGYQIAAEANTGVLWLDVNGGGVKQGFAMNTP